MDYRDIIQEYADIPGGLIEAYHALIKELGYLPEESIAEAARVFNISCAEAYGVATFYSLFSVNPKGKNIIRICASAPCHVAGMQEVVAALERELGIQVGHSTVNGQFSLEYTECVGQCQGSPAITINGKPYPNLDPAQIPSVLKEYS